MGKKKFRHGFKAEAESFAEDYREELGLAPHDPLCPFELASFLEIPVFGIKNNPALEDDVVEYWRTSSNGEFSGLVMQDGTFKQIVYNDFHHPRRQNSNLAHEIAHVALGHDLSAPIKSNREREYDSVIEGEAKWLGAALLMPKKATFHIVHNSLSREQVEEVYGVSYSLFQYRVQVTDTMRMVSNYRRKVSSSV